MFCKKGILKNFANFTGKHLCWRLLLLKIQASGFQLHEKETPIQVFSWEIGETFKNIYFVEHLERQLLVLASIQFGHATR